MVPEELVARWESAYRRYGAASRQVASASMATERDATHEFALASREVSAAWHDMERVSGLPWWVLAALVAGAQAFEMQAREWTARAQYSWPTAVARPPVGWRHGRARTISKPRLRGSSHGEQTTYA